MTDPRAPDVITALIADDEALARHRLVDLMNGRDRVRVVGESSNGPDTVRSVRDLSPDVLFLDVQMPGLNGFEVLAELDPAERPIVIFSTAYDEYALEAFEVHAVDYLLKPYSDERFEESIQRVEQALRGERFEELQGRIRSLLTHVGSWPNAREEPLASGDGALERFAARVGERIDLVDVDTVDWIEADGDYACLHVGRHSHLIRATMASLERRLDPNRFLRIHRSTIVRVDRVRQLLQKTDGSYVAVLAGDVHLRVSRSYRDELLERLGVR